MLISGKKIIGEFIRRINRFLVEVYVDNRMILANLRDSGRLKELLIEGKKILLLYKGNKKRKTKYEVLAIEHNNFWVLINPSYHTKIISKHISRREIEELSDCKITRKEVKVGRSRLDFELRCNNEKAFMEIKGCTLTIEGVGLFPDAPTERGRRHLEELMHLSKMGYKTFLFFFVSRPDTKVVSPNWITDPAFTSTLKKAVENGVNVIAYVFRFDGEEITKEMKVPVVLPDEIDDNLKARIKEELARFS